MINESVTVEQTIKLLNEMLAIDPEATQALIDSRVNCNEALADHATIQVQQYEGDDHPKVGIIGVLNGMFGIDDEGWGPICCHINDEGKILKFDRTKTIVQG